MSKTNLVIIALVFLAVSISCKSFMPARTAEVSRVPANNTGGAPAIDFTTPGKPLDVRVQLDKKQTASAKVPRAGGSLSLTAADGSRFTLDVPADALDADTTITMTAVKSLDGAPLDGNAPTAVQLEPSGLFFKEMATLTIVPGKEIPIKQQIAFGYEGTGKDYHMAAVDHKSTDIKIKLMRFSGAGIGSGSDAAWAANLMVQASNASTRLWQKFGEYSQLLRQKILLGGEDTAEAAELAEKMKSVLEQFQDQVILKEIVAAELDCKHGVKAMQDLLTVERQKQLLGFEPTPSFDANVQKLLKIIRECPSPYRIAGGLDDWQTNTTVCDIMKPFTLTGGGFTMQLSGGLSGTYDYSGPFNAQGSGTYIISLPGGLGKPGTMTGSGDGSAAGYTGSGTEKYTLTPIEPCS